MAVRGLAANDAFLGGLLFTGTFSRMGCKGSGINRLTITWRFDEMPFPALVAFANFSDFLQRKAFTTNRIHSAWFSANLAGFAHGNCEGIEGATRGVLYEPDSSKGQKAAQCRRATRAKPCAASALVPRELHQSAIHRRVVLRKAAEGHFPFRARGSFL